MTNERIIDTKLVKLENGLKLRVRDDGITIIREVPTGHIPKEVTLSLKEFDTVLNVLRTGEIVSAVLRSPTSVGKCRCVHCLEKEVAEKEAGESNQ